MKFITLILHIACCLLLLAQGTASAESWHRLAYSEKMGAEVTVENVDGSICNTLSTLRIKLQDDSPLLSGGLDVFLQKVGGVLQKECPATRSAKFEVYKASNNNLVASYDASADSGWKIQSKTSSPTSLDDEPQASRPEVGKATSAQHNIVTASAPMPEAPKPVAAEYLNLVSGVMPPADEVLSKSGAIFDYLLLAHCEKAGRAAKNEIEKAQLEKAYAEEAATFLGSPAPEFIQINFGARLGQYDLSKKAFAFTPLHANTKFELEMPRRWQCDGSKTFPPKIIINVAGGEFITELPLPEDKAEVLLKTLYDRRVTIVATLKATKWNAPSIINDDATVDTLIYSLKVSKKGEREPIYEYSSSWFGPRIAAQLEQQRQAEQLAKQKAEAERLARQQEEAAKNERLKNGTEPLELDAYVAMAHYLHLTDGEHYGQSTVNGFDLRRPLYFTAEAQYDDKEKCITVHTGLFERRPNMSPISYHMSSENRDKNEINIVIQNWKDFSSQKVPQATLDAFVKEAGQNSFPLSESYVKYTGITPVGFMNDPWKEGKGLVVHVSSAEYGLRNSNLFDSTDWKIWTVKADTPPQPYTSKTDDRTARELDIAGIHGGMELDAIQDLLKNKLEMETAFDESTKELTSGKTISPLVLLGATGEPFRPNLKSFKGFFVQTGKSLFGMGSPIFSLKQAVLVQTAKTQEKEAVLKGLIAKFGDPDLRLDQRNLVVYNWGKRITDIRTGMPVGEDLKRPITALEAQVYSFDEGVVTVLILTDELYLQKTEVTTKTVF